MNKQEEKEDKGEDEDDDNKDNEEEDVKHNENIPRARARPCVWQPPVATHTVNSMTSQQTNDPLATCGQGKPPSSADVFHFFRKTKGQKTVCIPCE